MEDDNCTLTPIFNSVKIDAIGSIFKIKLDAIESIFIKTKAELSEWQN